ncbi:MAG: hypothetical protein NC906_08330, partial [Candidatus Omnitrophica bacterium]|nr:hypothetical protein [Candidatus Omnitrophota bacterium]
RHPTTGPARLNRWRHAPLPSEAVFLGRDLVQQRNMSEATSREIDNEIKNILENAAKTAQRIILENREKLDILVKELLEKETLTSEEIKRILGVNNEQQTQQPGN